MLQCYRTRCLDSIRKQVFFDSDLSSKTVGNRGIAVLDKVHIREDVLLLYRDGNNADNNL